MKILIVDDNADDRRYLRYNVEHHGHEAIEAEDGQEGIEKAQALKPDLIISDAMMPRMDGFQFLRNIKKDENLRHIPFVFYSAVYTGYKDKELAMSLGASLFIVKPKDPEEFWNLINPIIEGIGRVVAFGKELIREDEEFLKSYSQIVVAKLEEKVKELEKEIEERKRAEDKLKISEERFRTVAETANDAIIAIKAPDIIYLWSRKAEEMFGYIADDAIGRGIHELIVPERYRERAREGMKRFFEAGTGPVIGKTIEIEAVRRDGTEFPVELSVSAMKIRGEWQSTGIIRDITERKKAEEKLRERLEELERFKKATIQRELRMKELRDRLEEFEKKEGRKQ